MISQLYSSSSCHVIVFSGRPPKRLYEHVNLTMYALSIPTALHGQTAWLWYIFWLWSELLGENKDSHILGCKLWTFETGDSRVISTWEWPRREVVTVGMLLPIANRVMVTCRGKTWGERGNWKHQLQLGLLGSRVVLLSLFLLFKDPPSNIFSSILGLLCHLKLFRWEYFTRRYCSLSSWGLWDYLQLVLYKPLIQCLGILPIKRQL